MRTLKILRTLKTLSLISFFALSLINCAGSPDQAALPNYETYYTIHGKLAIIINITAEQDPKINPFSVALTAKAGQECYYIPETHAVQLCDSEHMCWSNYYDNENYGICKHKKYFKKHTVLISKEGK